MVLKLQAIIAAAFNRQAKRQNSRPQTSTPDDLLAASDVLFFTLPDKEIESVYRQVSQLPIRGKIFCHCSGALSAQDAFPNIDDFSATGFSVHPLFAVSDKYNAYRK